MWLVWGFWIDSFTIEVLLHRVLPARTFTKTGPSVWGHLYSVPSTHVMDDVLIFKFIFSFFLLL